VRFWNGIWDPLKKIPDPDLDLSHSVRIRILFEIPGTGYLKLA
jgi:hypothetical protein